MPPVLSSNCSRPSTRSNAESDVLGRTSLHLQLPRVSPLSRRGESERPETARSTTPRMRARNPMVEVVSCATQTTPPASVATFHRQMKSAESVVLTQLTDSEDVEAAPYHARQCRRRSQRGKSATNRLTPTIVTTEIIVEGSSTPSERTKYRDPVSRNFDVQRRTADSSSHSASFNKRTYESASSHKHGTHPKYHNAYVGRPSYNSIRKDIMDIENVSTAIEQNNGSGSYSMNSASPHSPLSPVSSILVSHQVSGIDSGDRALTPPRNASSRSSPVVRVEPPTPPYQIDTVFQSFHGPSPDYYPTRSPHSGQTAPVQRCYDGAGAPCLRAYNNQLSEVVPQRYRDVQFS